MVFHNGLQLPRKVRLLHPAHVFLPSPFHWIQRKTKNYHLLLHVSNIKVKAEISAWQSGIRETV